MRIENLPLLKFRRAEHEARNQADVDVRHGIVELRAQYPRLNHFLLKRLTRRVGDLSCEEFCLNTVERQLRIHSNIRAYKRIDVHLRAAYLIACQCDRKI